jgi:hypothetical protein
MRQAENKVYIEGILAEVDIKEGSFVRDGSNVDYISGDIKVKVSQELNGETKDIEVPVNMYATKLTKKGTPNPAYKSIKALTTDFTSIAAAGGEAGADRVRLTGDLVENAFPGRNGDITSYPRVRASFVNKINASDCTPKATFTIELVVASKNPEVDKDGVETGRYVVKGIVPQYGGKVDVMDFIGMSKGVVDALSKYWTVGETFRAQGKLNFTSTTRTVTTEVDFGEPDVKTYTSHVSELVITGGSQTPLEGDFAFDGNEIKAALAQRKQRLEDQKNRTPKSPATPTFDSNDLGF